MNKRFYSRLPHHRTTALRLCVPFVAPVLAFACTAPADGRGGSGDVAASTNSKPSKEISVGLSMYTLGSPYFAAQRSAVQEAVRQRGWTFRDTDARDRVDKQIADVEDLLATGIDVLLLNPKDPLGLVPATLAAKEAGVPVVCLDSAIDPSAYYITDVQASNKQNGELVGRWLANTMGQTPMKIALLSGVQGNPVGQKRREGVFKGIIDQQLASHGRAGFEIVAQGWGNWTRLEGMRAMEDILVAHPDANVLVAENDTMALGARDAIKEAKRLDDILIAAAADGQKEALALIRQRQYGVTGLNNPGTIAHQAVDVAERYLKGQRNFAKITYTEPAAIDYRNVDRFYNPAAAF